MIFFALALFFMLLGLVHHFLLLFPLALFIYGIVDVSASKQKHIAVRRVACGPPRFQCPECGESIPKAAKVYRFCSAVIVEGDVRK
jgi:hypothetical protein